MEKDLIHLNSHSTTRPCSSSKDRFIDSLQGDSIHSSDLERAYQVIYEFIGASFEDTLIFTSSASEAINQVFLSVFLEISRKTGKCHFITSSIEDAPTMQMLKRLEGLGCFVKVVPVNDQGQVDLDQLKDLISPRTALISITAAHGLTGVVQPIEEISRLAQEKGVLLHLDGAYAMGKYDLSFVRPDYLTFSGELIHALKPSGGLFVKKGAPLEPLILGGADQGGFRGGPLDVPGFMALSAAVSQISLSFDAMSLEMARLRDLFEKEIQIQIPSAKILFSDTLRLPNTTVILFPGAHYEALHYLLMKKGIFCSIGGSYFQHLHRILAASKIEGGERALSFSLDRMMTEAEIIRAASMISKEVRTLRSLSEDL